MNPFEIMAQAMQGARSEDELVNKAAMLAPPPPMDFKPPQVPMPQNGVAQMPMPSPGGPMAAMAAPQKPQMVPPMSQAASRVTPRIGESLLGGGY